MYIPYFSTVEPIVVVSTLPTLYFIERHSMDNRKDVIFFPPLRCRFALCWSAAHTSYFLFCRFYSASRVWRREYQPIIFFPFPCSRVCSSPGMLLVTQQASRLCVLQPEPDTRQAGLDPSIAYSLSRSLSCLLAYSLALSLSRALALSLALYRLLSLSCLLALSRAYSLTSLSLSFYSVTCNVRCAA